MIEDTVPMSKIRAAGGLEKWLMQEATMPEKPAMPAMSAARGRTPADKALGYEADGMNSLERRYAGYLETQRRAGKFLLWRYEALTLRLAKKTTYTPDFYTLLPDGRVVLHEVKGFWRDDARVKIKVAAQTFPELEFVAVRWDSRAKSWKWESFSDHG